MGMNKNTVLAWATFIMILMGIIIIGLGIYRYDDVAGWGFGAVGIGFFANAQNIQVDSQTYSAQQLIENILIDSDCITNVVVTNFIGGNFNNSDKSYGYFDATGTTFPFQKGLVLSTGKLSNVDGPNTTLSDDNALNWLGDTDLELALNENIPSPNVSIKILCSTFFISSTPPEIFSADV